MIPIETILGMGEREIKDNDGGDEFKYIWHIVKTFVNATMYAYPAHQHKKITEKK
jgi:hypothetical protein